MTNCRGWPNLAIVYASLGFSNGNLTSSENARQPIQILPRRTMIISRVQAEKMTLSKIT